MFSYFTRFCRAEAPPFRAGEEARLLCGIDPPTTMSQKFAIGRFEVLSKPFSILNGMKADSVLDESPNIRQTYLDVFDQTSPLETETVG